MKTIQHKLPAIWNETWNRAVAAINGGRPQEVIELPWGAQINGQYEATAKVVYTALSKLT